MAKNLEMESRKFKDDGAAVFSQKAKEAIEYGLTGFTEQQVEKALTTAYSVGRDEYNRLDLKSGLGAGHHALDTLITALSAFIVTYPDCGPVLMAKILEGLSSDPTPRNRVFSYAYTSLAGSLGIDITPSKTLPKNHLPAP